MKTRISLLMIFSFLLFSCSSNDDNNIEELKKIKMEFKAKERQLFVGESLNLLNELILEKVDPETIIWTVSNPKVIQLEKNTIKAIGKGESTVVATLKNSTHRTTLKITVSDYKIIFKHDKIAVEHKKTVDLNDILSLENLTKDQLVWSSSNNDIATVVEGKVTTLKEGEVVISAAAKGKNIKSSLTIVVTPILVVTLKSTPEIAEMIVGGKLEIKLNATPADANISGIVWRSSDEKIAKVNDKGEVQAINGGNVIISATTTNGVVAYTRIVVKNDGITSIKILPGHLDVLIDGESTTINVEFSPNTEAKRSDLEFSSNNADVKVDAKGKVTTTVGKYGVAKIRIGSKVNRLVYTEVSIRVIKITEFIKDHKDTSGLTTTDGKVSGKFDFRVFNVSNDREIAITGFAILGRNGELLYGNNFNITLGFGENHLYSHNFTNSAPPAYVEYQVAYLGQSHTVRTNL